MKTIVFATFTVTFLASGRTLEKLLRSLPQKKEERESIPALFFHASILSGGGAHGCFHDCCLDYSDVPVDACLAAPGSVVPGFEAADVPAADDESSAVGGPGTAAVADD